MHNPEAGTGLSGTPLAPRSQVVLFAALCLASLVPLLLVDLPPLVDLYGHFGRYAIQTELAERPLLQPFYSYEWKLIGNLGADLLVEALHPLLGLEGSVRTAVMLTQLLASAGILAVTRAVHGRITPFAIAALPLIYGLPFNYGFINYALGMALTLLAFAQWLRLRAAGYEGWARLWLLVAGGTIWLCHTYGWAFLGLMCGAAMVAEVLADRPRLLTGVVRILVTCGPLLAPLAAMILWRANAGATFTGDWSLGFKINWLVSVLRTRWVVLDGLSGFAVISLVYWAARAKGVRFDTRLALAAGFALGTFLVLPMFVLGSAYADMRLAPYILILALVAIDPRTMQVHSLRLIGAGAATFFAVRMVTTGWAYVEHDREVAAYLPALKAMPPGARVAFFVVKPCGAHWPIPILDHVGSLALVRRNVFVNDQWQGPGFNPLTVHYAAAGAFMQDPSQAAVPDGCAEPSGPPLSTRLAQFPRKAFSHVWIVGDVPDSTPVPADLVPIAHSGKGRLYAVASAQ